MVNIQQQLRKRNTYTPIDTSQVCCSVAMSLNREETLSEHSLKTCLNNLDVNQRSRKSEQDLRVLVINIRNQPLMPTNTARHQSQQLLKNKLEVKTGCNTDSLGIPPTTKVGGFPA